MHCIIIDHDERAVKRLENLFSILTSPIIIDEILLTINDAISYMDSHPCPDLIFMDMNFPEGSALGILEYCTVRCPVIITSLIHVRPEHIPAHPQIIQLSKPVRIAQLEKIIDGIVNNKINFLAVKLNDGGHDTLKLKFGKNFYVTKWNEVAYITKQENMSFVIRNDGLKLPVNLSLKEIATKISEVKFIPISKNTTVNVSAIHSISKKNGRKILNLLPDINTRLEIHPKYVDTFMKWLKENYA